MEYTRGRVAISVAVQPVPLAQEFLVPRHCIPLHVGHARTLILGSLICKELGIPYHIRIDGTLAGINISDCITDMIACMQFLGVEYDYFYNVGMWETNYAQLGNRIGVEGAEKVYRYMLGSHLNSNHGTIATMLDDFLDHAPSLIIRGVEFATLDVSYLASNLTGATGLINAEYLMCEALGTEKHELNVPLIVLGDKKMSKSCMTSIPWMALTMMDSQLVRKFLVATAMESSDPFSALDRKFTIAKMTKQPYIWSWDDFAKLVRM